MFFYMPDIQTGVPWLDFSMAVSAGGGKRRPQPAATSNIRVLISSKRSALYVANLDACAYLIYADHQPDPHPPVYLRVATEFKYYLLAIMYTRH